MNEPLELLTLESASQAATAQAADVGRDFMAAFQRVRGSPPSHCAKFSAAEMNEYAIVVAALDCRIDPREIPAQILSLISGTAGKTEPTTATTEVDHGI